ncbi:hypothetical protein FXO38_07903 [Capsicum annuum]|nr:hypothetical protein FXO38_07903 [Capsicum annuum]
MVLRNGKEDLLKFYTLLNAFRWDMLTESVPQYNIEVIFEFYANLPTEDYLVSLPTTCVQGKRILVDVPTINETLDVSNHVNSIFEVRILASKLEWDIEVFPLEGKTVEMKCPASTGQRALIS